MRYADGAVLYSQSDLGSSGFGLAWGHTRVFGSRLSSPTGGLQGNSWVVVPGLQYIACPSPTTKVVVRGPEDSLWFDKSGSDWVGRFSIKATLEEDAGSNELVLTEPRGDVYRFYDNDASHGAARCKLREVETAGGVTAQLVYDSEGRVTRFDQSGGGKSVAYLYSYLSGGAGDGLLGGVTLQVDGADVRRASYSYYGAGEANGNEDDLEKVVLEGWNDAGTAWVELRTNYYRYYTGGNFKHGLKYVSGAEGWERMLSDGIDPETASDAQLAEYAEHKFVYDAQHRVTLHAGEGGGQVHAYSYPGPSGSSSSSSAGASAYNTWTYKTVETLPDGRRNVVYCNYAMEVMLRVFKSGSSEWYSYAKYDAATGKARQLASSAAVQEYSEASPGLVTLKSTGLITNKEWYTSTGGVAADGYLKEVSVQDGSGGSPVKQRTLEYVGHPAGAPTVFQVSKETVYRSEGSGGSDEVDTIYEYDYHDGTRQVKQKTTTAPVVPGGPTGQNGDGKTYKAQEYYDLDGRVTWSKDWGEEEQQTGKIWGIIDHTVYDEATGAVVQRVRDVDTSVTAGAPDGWTTEAGAGLNLVTDYEFDASGRTTQELGPWHTVDIGGAATPVRRARFTVYRDDIREVWRASGYASGQAPGYGYTTANPVSITRADADGRTVDQIAAARGGDAPFAAGRLSAADSFPQSSWLRWGHSDYDNEGLMTRSRSYFDIPGSGDGLHGENFTQAEYGYDSMDRRVRVESGEGTIERTVYDARGLATERWVGTDDTGATDGNPGAGGAPNNMVKVLTDEYDDGNAGGNGLLTESTQHVSGSADRVTKYDYDWRDRQTGVDGEENTYTKTEYDNLGRATSVEQRHTDATGTLLGKSETDYDDRGQVYRSKTWGVSGGSTTHALTTNTWRDGQGREIKVSPPGGEASTKTVYDSLGRVTASYLSYPEDGVEVDSNSVADDIVVEQTETGYDAASNTLETRSYQRFHDAPDSGAGSKGALNGPGGTDPEARVYYRCSWPDPLGRAQASADYGTNGGAAVERPDTVPASSDTVLVSGTAYDAAGQAASATDPTGRVDTTSYDDLGRQIKTVEDDTGGAPSGGSDRTAEYAYNLDGNLVALTLKNGVTGDQVTRWEYGVAPDTPGAGIASTRLLAAKVFPDAADADDPLSPGGADRVSYEYNRAGQVTQMTDQNGTVHEYDYDGLGALTHDRVTTLAAGIDGRVRRISTTYTDRRQVEAVTSYDHPEDGSGSAVNGVGFVYDAFGQVTQDRQDHDSAASGSSQKVSYSYEDGSDNNVRLTRTTYPDGRQIDTVYGAAGSMDDILSRPWGVEELALQLAYYEYLGAGTPVVATSPQPSHRLTYVKLGAEPDGDGGDQYNGLDRFGRVQDQRWTTTASNWVEIERFRYGYDRAGLKQWRHDPLAAAAGEAYDDYYTYDGLYQVAARDRGHLNTNRTAIAGTPAEAEAWRYDPSGNWENYTRDVDGAEALDQDRTHDEANEIRTFGGSGSPVGYDAAGNMTRIPAGELPADGEYEATWDAWNRLVRVKTPGGSSSSSSSSSSGSGPAPLDASYEYDGLHRRTLRDVAEGADPGAFDDYYDRSWRAVERHRREGGAQLEMQWVYGYRGRRDMVARDCYSGCAGSSSSSSAGGKVRHYALSDAMGSVTAITNTTGVVLERYAYGPFGASEALAPDYTPRGAAGLYRWGTRFHGEARDPETGYYNYGYRYLAPGLGRWLSRDPIGEQGGLNLYAAYANDGVNSFDALGAIKIEEHPLYQVALAATRDAWEQSWNDEFAGKYFGATVSGPVLNDKGEPIPEKTKKTRLIGTEYGGFLCAKCTEGKWKFRATDKVSVSIKRFEAGFDDKLYDLSWTGLVARKHVECNADEYDVGYFHNHPGSSTNFSPADLRGPKQFKRAVTVGAARVAPFEGSGTIRVPSMFVFKFAIPSKGIKHEESFGVSVAAAEGKPRSVSASRIAIGRRDEIAAKPCPCSSDKLKGLSVEEVRDEIWKTFDD